MSPPLILLLALPLLAPASEVPELQRTKRQTAGERTVFSCSFTASSWCNMFSPSSGYDFTWTLKSGATPSSNTGPSCDHTSCGGYYVYTEASSPRQLGDRAGLVLSLAGSATATRCLRFFVSMYGAAMGSLQVFLSNSSSPDPSLPALLRLDTSLGAPWFQRDVTISRGTDARYIVFVGTIGHSYTSDIAIDDVTVTEGANCQGRLDPPQDPCGQAPCSNNGTCREAIAAPLGFTCTCPSGFTGQLCDQDVNECMSSPCDNSGVCSNHYGSFSCSCPPGFSGTTCQIGLDPPQDPCGQAPCSNNGTCREAVAAPLGFTCTCPSGFTGQLCDQDVNECMSSPCDNSGVCSNHYGGFSCFCPPGFSGTTCQIVSPLQRVRQALEDAREEARKSQTQADQALRHLREAWAEADALRRRR